jgi:hypothetical protein
MPASSPVPEPLQTRGTDECPQHHLRDGSPTPRSKLLLHLENAYWPTRHLTQHALQRMADRGISHEAVTAVLTYGHAEYRSPGSKVFVLTGREIAYYARRGIDLAPFEGVHVVCALADNSVLTVFRSPKRSTIDGK